MYKVAWLILTNIYLFISLGLLCMLWGTNDTWDINGEHWPWVCSGSTLFFKCACPRPALQTRGMLAYLRVPQPLNQLSDKVTERGFLRVNRSRDEKKRATTRETGSARNKLPGKKRYHLSPVFFFFLLLFWVQISLPFHMDSVQCLQMGRSLRVHVGVFVHVQSEKD